MEVASKHETVDVASKYEIVDVAFKAAWPAAAAAAETTASAVTTAAPAEAIEEPWRRRWPRALAAVGWVLLLFGGVGVAFGMFTGFGQQFLHGGASVEVE